MGYTIIEYLEAGDAEPGKKRAIGTYDCAYDAVDAIRAALQNDNDRVWSWYLVDDVGTVLFGPTDLAAIMAESEEFQAPRGAGKLSGGRRPPGVPNTSGLRGPGRAVARSADRGRERHASGLLSDSDLSWD